MQTSVIEYNASVATRPAQRTNGASLLCNHLPKKIWLVIYATEIIKLTLSKLKKG